MLRLGIGCEELCTYERLLGLEITNLGAFAAW